MQHIIKKETIEEVNNIPANANTHENMELLFGPNATYRRNLVLINVIQNMSVKDKKHLFGMFRKMTSINDACIFFPRHGFTFGEFSTIYTALNHPPTQSENDCKVEKDV